MILYRYLPKVDMRVPTQYGGRSIEPRRCYYLGSMGTTDGRGREVRLLYYRIAHGEKGAGKFFKVARHWEGMKCFEGCWSIHFAGIPKSIISAAEAQSIKNREKHPDPTRRNAECG